MSVHTLLLVVTKECTIKLVPGSLLAIRNAFPVINVMLLGQCGSCMRETCNLKGRFTQRRHVCTLVGIEIIGLELGLYCYWMLLTRQI